MKKITFFHEYLINTCLVSKTKLLFLFTIISALSYGQTFDWETGTLLSFGSSNQNIIAKQIVNGYEVNFSASGSGTPILLGTFNQGTTGKAVMNQQPQQVVRLAFFPAVDIQSLKAFSANASTVNWTFTPVNSPGNAVVTANVAQNAVTVNLNWTNVSIIDITATNGSSQNFGVDDIVFSPYTPCTVTIPDANFKAYLVGNTAINTNGDTEIQCSEASAFTGAVIVNGLNISDLTGIEAFTNISVLNCRDNALTSLDISQNTALLELLCQSNALSSLDVSTNTLLTRLWCDDNSSISSLNVSSNTALVVLSSGNNNLTSIDISSNTALVYLSCYNNSITSIDLSNNTVLVRVVLDFNGLTNLDISSNTALENLSFQSNALTNLDLSSNTALKNIKGINNGLTSLDVSSNLALESLQIDDNSFTSLDISNNTFLNVLQANNNSLTGLNVANGNNANFVQFNALNNQDLTCIQIDAAFTPPTTWQKDATASYSEDCAALSVDEFNLNTISLHPNPTNSILNIEMTKNIKQATVYSMLGKEVLKTQNKQIDVSRLLNGIFLIKIEDENGNVSTKRFIKQ